MPQHLAVLRSQHGAPAGGQHQAAGLLRHIGQHTGFEVAKTLFTLGFKKTADGGANHLLKPVVQVHECHTKPVGQLSANGGLSRAGHADQCTANLHKPPSVSGTRHVHGTPPSACRVSSLRCCHAAAGCTGEGCRSWMPPRILTKMAETLMHKASIAILIIAK